MSGADSSVCRDAHLAKLSSQRLFVLRILLADRLKAADSTDSQTGSQLPRLPPSHLKLTTVESFWTSVETSAAMSKPLPATVNYIQSNNPDEPLLLSLKKTVIILPRIVTMIRPIGSKTKRLAKNHVWNDTAAWDQDVLLTMLGKFVNLTGAKTIPSLAEYRILPDKVRNSCLAMC